MGNKRFQPLIATASQWSTKNPVLLDGEKGTERDTKRSKTGDGTTPWNSLTYDNEDVYNETTLATINQGDIKAGDVIGGRKVVSILRDILSPYAAPSFNNFTASGSQNYNLEVGTILSSNYNLSWAISNIDNIQDANSGVISCDDPNAFQNLGNVNLKNLSYVLNSVVGYTYNLPDKIRLSITGQNTKGANIGSRSINWNWLGRIRFGVRGTAGITTQANIDSLGTNFLSDKNGLSRDFNFGVGYIFIAIPSFIDVSGIKFTDNDNGLAFSMATQNSWDNSLPEMVSYNNGNTTFNYRIFRGEFYYNTPTSVKIGF